jgi:hypothetical protein
MAFQSSMAVGFCQAYSADLVYQASKDDYIYRASYSLTKEGSEEMCPKEVYLDRDPRVDDLDSDIVQPER